MEMEMEKAVSKQLELDFSASPAESAGPSEERAPAEVICFSSFKQALITQRVQATVTPIVESLIRSRIDSLLARYK